MSMHFDMDILFPGTQSKEIEIIKMLSTKTYIT